MTSKFKVYTLNLLIILFVILFTHILSEALNKIIVVRPKIRLSQISAIYALQLWYYVLILIILFFSVLIYHFKSISVKSLLTYLFYSGILLNILFITTASKLALSKTPLPPGAITGDNYELLMGMIRAQESGWSGNSYPPVWLSAVGNTARILNFSVLEIWKSVYFLGLIIFPLIILFSWRQVFNPLAASAFTFISTFGPIDWKGVSPHIFFAMFIATVIRATTDNRTEFDWRQFSYGLFLGLGILTYFGYLWWSVLAIFFLVFIIWFTKNRLIYFTKTYDAGLGVLLILAPSQIGPKIGLNGWITLTIVISLIVSRILLQKVEFITGVFAYLTGLIVPATLIFFMATIKINDSWFYPELEVNDAPNLGFGFNITGFLFLLLINAGILLAFKNQVYRTIIFISLLVFISSSTMMFWYAARMEVTNLVELFPRAQGNFYFSWNILVFLAIFVLLNQKLFLKNIMAVWPTALSKINTYLLVLILLTPFLIVHARTLSTTQEGLFPKPENGAWYAYQACVSPEENTLLVEVFLEKPFIEEFLRENCPNVNWPALTTGS